MNIFAYHIAKRTQDGKAIANKPQCGKRFEPTTGKYPYVELTRGFCDQIRRGSKICKNCLATAVEQGRVSKELAKLASQRTATQAMNATTELSKVYKANQCSDASDFEYAISEVTRIAHKYGWTPAVRARFVSLERAKASA